MKFLYKFFFSLWERERIRECKVLGFQEKFFKKRGLKIFYLYKKGKEDLPALVCIHGFLDACYGFRKLLKELSYPGSIYIPDLPGYGRSKLPRMDFLYQLDIFSELLGYWLEKIPEKKLILLGHSMGGLIVQKIALYKELPINQRIQALILLAPGGIPHPRRDEMRGILFPKTKEDLKRLLNHLYYENIPELSFWTERVLLATWNNGKNHALAENTIRKENIIFHGKKVQGIQIPTLLVGGEKDELVTVDMMRKFHKWIPQSELTILPLAKHAIHNEKPKEVALRIQTFLKNWFKDIKSFGD